MGDEWRNEQNKMVELLATRCFLCEVDYRLCAKVINYLSNVIEIKEKFMISHNTKNG